MFDVEKVCRMTDELEKFARAHEEIYLTFESVTGDALALFRRLKINARAMIVDDLSKKMVPDYSFWINSLNKEFYNLPALKTSDAAKNFSEHTGIIAVVKKNLPFFQTELPFVVNNRRLLVPVFILTPDEISAIYARLVVSQTLQMYAEDGFGGNVSAQIFAMKIMQGFKSFLDPKNQTLKYQFLDEQQFSFKYELSDAAIVLQGPLVYENNYTAETLKLYRKIYPNAPIVVSTWTGEATDDFRETCKKNSVVLLENAPPKIPGPYNINMQLESSLQGVNFVREKTSAKFVLKTRCDQRINKADFLTYFRNLVLTFPPIGDKLRGRIILLDGSKWLPFRTADFFAFGYVEDIFKLYGIPIHQNDNSPVTSRKRHESFFNGILSLISLCKKTNYIPLPNDRLIWQINKISRRMYEVEAYLLKKFYEENIAAIDYDKFLETGWKFMRDYLVIVGVLDVCLDWPKYEDSSQYEVKGEKGLTNEIDFSRWLDLYRNYKTDWV